MARLLEPLREIALPPSTVDVGRAIRDARRRQRHSRLIWSMASIAAAAALAAPAVFALQAIQPSHNAPFGLGGATGDGGGFDPLTTRVSVPDVAGLHVSDHYTSAGQERVILTDQDASGERTRMVELILVPPGRRADFTSRGSEPADGVNGRRAFWLSGTQMIDQYAGVRFAFEWADNAWAYVAAVTTPGDRADPRPPYDELRQAAREVAEAIVVGAPEPVQLPFVVPATPPGIPDHFVPTGTHTLRKWRIPPGEPFVRASVFFTDPRADARSQDGVSIAAISVGGLPDKPVNGYIDGHRARLDATTVVVYDLTDGYTLELTSRIAAAGGEVDLVELAHAVEIVDGAADENRWTSFFLR